MVKKRLAIGLVAVFIFSGMAFAAADEEAIRKQVDEIVVSINSGKSAEEFNDAAKREPYYVFIMEQNGYLLVHPYWGGQNLKEKAEPAYSAVSQSTPEGTWVDYEWQGGMKHTYVRTTRAGLIVGSGYMKWQALSSALFLQVSLTSTSVSAPSAHLRRGRGMSSIGTSVEHWLHLECGLGDSWKPIWR